MRTKHFFLKNNTFFIISFSALFLFLLGSLVLGANSYKIDKGKSLDINEHNVCKKVTNNCDLSIFVPTKTPDEWNSFIKNPPFCVSLSDCPSGDLNCSGGSKTSINLAYDFRNGTNVSLFRGNTKIVDLGSGDKSGSYENTGLKEDTKYTFYLRNGTSKDSPELAKITCSTPFVETFRCSRVAWTSITLTYDFRNGTNVSLFRGNTEIADLGSGSKSGSKKNTGLKKDTEYTFYLRNGTSKDSPELAKITCNTSCEVIVNAWNWDIPKGRSCSTRCDDDFGKSCSSIGTDMKATNSIWRREIFRGDKGQSIPTSSDNSTHGCWTKYNVFNDRQDSEGNCKTVMENCTEKKNGDWRNDWSYCKCCPY